MKKSILLFIILLGIVLTNSSFAAYGAVYVDYMDNFSMSKEIYSEITDYATDMGYTCYGRRNPTNSAMISHMKSSNIYIASGHGSPGLFESSGGTYIVGKNMGSSGTYIALSTLPSSSLKNLKLAFWYSCESGLTESEWGNLIDVTVDKGAKCTVGWNDSIKEEEDVIWNKLFFEKVQTETIVEGFRHADYWLEVKKGTAAKNRMQNRYERGNIYQTLY